MGCKGDFEAVEGPVHEYMESTPGCWSTYTTVLAREYENYAAVIDVHRLSADTYAVQHPGQPSRRSTQSVWGHLVMLHCSLERGLDGEKARLFLRRFLDKGFGLVWLQPPDFSGSLNVGYVSKATNSRDHIKRAKEWANSVYVYWRRMHAAEIGRMADRVFEEF